MKAKAFRAGCDASATTTILYEVVDTVPPTISASVDPPPNAAGWHHGNVTVTFTCSDSGLPAASCTAPVTVYGEGSPIEVKGVAIDAAGNRSEVTVSLNVDRSAPRLTFHAPEAGDCLPPTTTSVTVRGNVLESLSGVESVTCGTAAATVTGQLFTCDVPVVAGANAILVTARDMAGSEATRSVSFSVSDPPAPTSLEITPAKMTMGAGESRDIRVVDERGRLVTGGTWTIDQPLVAEVAVEEGTTRVTALGSGEATLTLTRDGLSAEAVVTVLASGTVPPEGTALWESAPLGEPSVKRGQVIRANRTDDGSTPSADLFFIDEGTEGAGIYIYRVNNRPTTIRAMTFDGQQLWSRNFAGEAMIKDVAADAHGGLILVLTPTFDTDGLPERVQRIDGATGKVSWQYFAPDDGPLSEVAVHPDGTVFVSTEGYYYPDVTYLIALDGETGAEARWRLPDASSPTGPVVRDDGSVVVLFNPHDDETSRHLQLATLADGSATLQLSDTYLPSPNPYFYAVNYRLIPHEDALLVAQTRNGTDVMRIGPDNTMGPVSTLLPPDFFRTVAQVDYAVGGSTGMAIIRRESGQYQAPYNVYTAVFDTVSLAGGAIWAGTDPYATYRFITPGGGVHVSGEATSNDTQVAPGLWVALGQTAAMKIGSVIETHFSSPYLPGGIDSTNGASLRIYVPQPLQTEPNQGTIRSTILNVKEALVAEGAPPPVGSCGAWLATGDISGTEMTDVLLLKEPFEGQEKDRFGHGIFSSVPLRIVAFSAQNLISAFVGGRNPDMSAVGVPIYFAVTFNDYGAFFSAFDRDTGKELREGPYRGGTSQAQARILIHEMAHLLHVPGFQADALSRIAGASNDRLVEQNCGQLVGGIR